MIEIKDKADCCACTACSSICPQKCIVMNYDNEEFKYPIIDTNKCIDCGLCERVCPIINNSEEVKKEQKAFLINIKDEDIRKQSTAGGAFTGIAEYVLDRNGVVYGASFDESFKVNHMSVDKKEDLYKFRGSKYVQSDLRDTFKEVKTFLEQGRTVCYSGLPCQIEGLKSFLKNDYPNLIMVDVACHAVPSPLVWRKYLNFIKCKLNAKQIKRAVFRDKSEYGYKYSMMTVETDNGIYSEGIDTDPYLRAFFSDLSDRPSCYNCKFKKQYRVSDFTIWDCFIVENFHKSLDDDKGTTRVLIHSEKGYEIFNEIKENYNFKEVEPAELVNNVKEMFYSVSENKLREKFFADVNIMKEEEFFNTYFPINTRVKVERFTRKFLAKLGIYKIVKRTAKKILRK